MAVYAATGAVACGQFAASFPSSISPPPQKTHCHSLQRHSLQKDDTFSSGALASEHLSGGGLNFINVSHICSDTRVSRPVFLCEGLKCWRTRRSKKNQTIKCMRVASVSDDVGVKVLDDDHHNYGANLSVGSKSQRNQQQGEMPALKVPPRPAPRPISGAVQSPEQSPTGTVKELSSQRNAGQGSRPNLPLKTQGSNVQNRLNSSDAVQALDQILKKAEHLGSHVPSQATGRVVNRQNQNQRQPSQTQWRRSNKNQGTKVGFSSPKKVSVEQPQNDGNVANAGSKQISSENVVEGVEPVAPVASDSPLIRPVPLIKPKPVLIQRPPVAPPVRPRMLDRKPQMVDKNRRPVDPVCLVTDASSRAGSVQQSPVRRQPILRDVGAAAKAAVAEPSTKDLLKSPPKSKTGESMAKAASPEVSSKPAKAAPSKAKDERQSKPTEVMDGAKRRGLTLEKEDDPKAGELDVDADAAATTSSRGRKYTKARRKAERIEASKASAPVRVDILEVGKEGMSVQDLAGQLAVNDSEIVKALFMKGIVSTVNQILDEETVKLVCKEFDVEVIESGSLKVEDMAKKMVEFVDEDDYDSLQVRPPVVTIMGHVDHGKTSLLDYIRKSKVAASEAGGITQGIGAYRVLVPVGGVEQSCVFLDTPGHEAFSAMRARGARVTDIVVIVVAADDGVRPQTIEAIAHAKAANVPAVVAINKIDKEGANPDRVMQEVSSAGLMPEEWGGDVPMVQVSALTGKNVEQLLETIMLVAEFQDLKANPDRGARGTVIEASLDKTRGPVATFLVQNGTLRKGDVVLCGESYGKVRALLDDTGARVDDAGPSTAVQVMGLNSVPVAGDEFESVASFDEARQKAIEQAEAMRDVRLAALAGEGKLTLATLASAAASAKEAGVESHQLNIILKVDVQGSAEAIKEALQVLPQDSVQLRFLMQAPGEINASDIDLAVASQAIIIGFKVGVQTGIKARVEKELVEIRLYEVIYDLVEDMRQAMEGLLQPVEEQLSIGKAEVRAIFSSGSGRVAGCMVTEGKLVKGCGVKVLRGNILVCTSTLSSLRRVKEVAKEVSVGLECGVGVGDFDEWEQGDVIEAFNMVSKKKTLEEASAQVTSTLSAS